MESEEMASTCSRSNISDGGGSVCSSGSGASEAHLIKSAVN